MLLTFEACGHLPACPQTNKTICTPSQQQSMSSPEMVTRARSTTASTWLRFWRCSLTNLQTSGSPSTSSSWDQHFGPFTPTSLADISDIDGRWVFRIFGDNLTDAVIKLVAPCTRVVDRYMPWIVWIAILSWLSFQHFLVLPTVKVN